MLDRIDEPELMGRHEFEQLEHVVERGRDTFVQVGQALAAIRDRRGYRLTGYTTFEAYLQERWGWSRQRGYQLIQGAEVAVELATTRCQLVLTFRRRPMLGHWWRSRRPSVSDADSSSAPKVVEYPLASGRSERRSTGAMSCNRAPAGIASATRSIRGWLDAYRG